MVKRKNTTKNSSTGKKQKLIDEDEDTQENYPGTIAKVTLQNFMCHSNLEFDFGPGINFIVGRNGSGKTAVLNGIILCLGGHSSDTGGSSNVQGFIQTNKHVATICVTLRNKGEDAYSSDVFGNFITIERKLQRNGHGSYKIKNATGEVISMKKDDLDVILNYFNIQVSNPISILTQNMSKMFLLPRDTSKDIKNKYKFFLNSTQVGILKENIENMRRVRKAASAAVKTKKDNVSTMEKRNARLRRQRKVLDNWKNLSDKLVNLTNEKVWAVVRDLEADQTKFRRMRQGLKKKADELLLSILEHEKLIHTFNKDLATFKEDESSLQLEKQRKFDRKTSAVKVFQDHGNNLKRLIEVKVKEIQMEIKRTEEKIVEIEGHIRCLSEQNIAEQKEKQESEIDMYEKCKAKACGDLQEADKQIEQIHSDLNLNKEKYDYLEQEYKCLRDKRQAKEEAKTHMNQSLLNQDAQFGPKMPQLLSMIEHPRNQFYRKPIGPIGKFVRIKNPKWAFAVENCISRNFLFTFCCDNVDDARKLKDLMKQIYGRTRDQMPTIFTCRFTDRVYDDITRIRPQNFSSIHNLITCTNPVVMNCLLDAKCIDRILLVENSNDAMDLMMTNPPQNCMCCFTIKGDSVFPSPNYRYYSCKKKYQISSLLQQCSQEDINNIGREIMQLQNEEKVKLQQIATIENRMRELEGNLNNEKKNKYKANKKIINLSRNIDDIKRRVPSELNVSIYTEELNHQNNLLLSKRSELIALEKEIQGKKMQLVEAEKEKTNAYLEHDRINEMWVMLEDKIVSTKQNQAKQINLLETDKTALSRIENQINELNVSLQEIADGLKEQTNHRKQYSRIETNRRVEDLELEIKQTKKTLDQMTINGKTGFDEIFSNEEKLNALRQQIEAANKRNKKLKANIEDRSRCYEHIRSLVSLRIQYAFEINVKSRAFVGKTTFDHAKSTLLIEAQPEYKIKKRRRMSENVSTDMQSLSGGERSFVTVSLLMALAEVSEMPFHIFDEYDVFMDDMNKTESIKLMMENAKEQYGKQFIFLSPLSYPSFIRRYNVKVHRMPDPER